MLSGPAWLFLSPRCQNQVLAAGRCLFPSGPLDTPGLCTPQNCSSPEQPGIYKRMMGKWQIPQMKKALEELVVFSGTWVKPGLKLWWWSSLPALHRGWTVSCRRPGWCGRRSRPGGSPQAAGGGRWGRSAGVSQAGLCGSKNHLHWSSNRPNKIQSDFSFFFFSVTCVRKLAEVRLLDLNGWVHT